MKRMGSIKVKDTVKDAVKRMGRRTLKKKERHGETLRGELLKCRERLGETNG